MRSIWCRRRQGECWRRARLPSPSSTTPVNLWRSSTQPIRWHPSRSARSPTPSRSAWAATPSRSPTAPGFAQNGRRLFVSYWDAGTIELDISNPTNPIFVNRTQLLQDEDRDNHSMTEVGGRWMIINPEDFSPNVCGPSSGGWGEAWLYQRRNGQTRFRGTFATPNSQSTRTDGIYTVHNTEVWGTNQAFSSWYTDGIRWWQFSKTGQTREHGY